MSLPKFDATDINKNSISNEIFKNHKLTFVNIWNTDCNGCIEEIPDLEKLSQNLKKNNIQLLSIVKDGANNENLVNEILNKQNGTYLTIIPDENLAKFLESYTLAPTSLLLNEIGEVISDPIIGVKSIESYEHIIFDTLDKIKH